MLTGHFEVSPPTWAIYIVFIYFLALKIQGHRFANPASHFSSRSVRKSAHKSIALFGTGCAVLGDP